MCVQTNYHTLSCIYDSLPPYCFIGIVLNVRLLCFMNFLTQAKEYAKLFDAEMERRLHLEQGSSTD